MYYAGISVCANAFRFEARTYLRLGSLYCLALLLGLFLLVLGLGLGLGLGPFPPQVRVRAEVRGMLGDEDVA